MRRVFVRVRAVLVLVSIAGFVAAIGLPAASAWGAPLGSVTEYAIPNIPEPRADSRRARRRNVVYGLTLVH